MQASGRPRTSGPATDSNRRAIPLWVGPAGVGCLRLVGGGHGGAVVAVAAGHTRADSRSWRAAWTMQMLADRMVTPGHVDAVSDETVRQAL